MPKPEPRLNRRHSFLLGALSGAAAAMLAGSLGGAEVEVELPPEPPPLEQASPAEPPPEAPAEEETASNRVEGEVRPNEFISEILARAGASAVEADALVAALRPHFDFRRSRPGHRYALRVEAGLVESFEYTAGLTEVYDVARVDGRLVASRRALDLETQVVEVSGRVERSLYEAFADAGESTQLAVSLAEAFEYDIDFFRETRRGDRFHIVVEKLMHEGKLVRYGRVHAAEYQGVEGGPIGTKRLYWYEDQKAGVAGYYDASGKAARKPFLRSPLKFSRISSAFGVRVHPITRHKHFHGGVDYAAPTGTPVHAVAGGRVTFAARKGPAGNLVQVRHDGGYESYYLHLSKISVRVGQRLNQSAVVGLVGSTGRSTGPHLDFRLKQHGKYLDPTKHVVAPKEALTGRHTAAFASVVAKWKPRLEARTLVAQQ